MGKLNRYLIDNFFSSFFTLFAILFVIASMVLLLAISNMTALLKIDIYEFLYLYLLSLPEIIFYTLPLSFFITSALSVSKLFENSELITILSLGVTPSKIVRPFLYLSVLISAVLLVITFFSIPTSQILYRNFFNTKKIESQFNFSPSSIGQKFGEWNLFIDTKEKNRYKKIVMYNNNKHVFIIADSAKTSKKDNYFILSLQHGHLYNQQSKTAILSFSRFDINQKIKITPLSFNTIGEYLKKYKKKTNKYLIISFFPIVSFFFLATISFFHNRYQKNHSVIYSAIIAVSYYAVTFIVYKNLYAILLIVPIFFVISQVFKKRIKQF
jgi:lipopolysaccharide export system permease protein